VSWSIAASLRLVHQPWANLRHRGAATGLAGKPRRPGFGLAPGMTFRGSTVAGAKIWSGDARFNAQIGFNNTAPIAKPTVSGSRADPEAALANLLTALANYGLITNSTTA